MGMTNPANELIASIPHSVKQVMTPTYIGSVANGEPIPLTMPEHDPAECLHCRVAAIVPEIERLAKLDAWKEVVRFIQNYGTDDLLSTLVKRVATLENEKP
jgi:hypothetical protein